MDAIIFHNPRCQKSREALAFLEETNHKISVREYLKEPPSFRELKSIIDGLGIDARKLIRQKEEIFKPYLNKRLTEEEAIALMVKHPVLIERPIVCFNSKWVLARPLENLKNITQD
jgi:arsenate reductase